MKVLHLLWRAKNRLGTGLTNLYRFWTNRRLAAAALLAEVLTVVSAQATLPVHALVATVQASEQTEAATLVLNTTSIDSMVTSQPRSALTITVVPSRVQEQKHAAQRAVVPTNASPAPVDTDVPLEIKRELVKAAAAQYGIDWKILEAVWQIESGKRWVTAVRSYVGAQGPMQFMPGTWRSYAVDGNSDGVANVNDARDAVYAGANYLAANGAASDVDGALFHYNHAGWYVTKVKAIAASIDG